MIDILVPAEQEGTTAVVRSWLKKVGDAVAEHDPLVELETDKVTQEVSSPAAGILEEILLSSDAEAVPGAVLGRLRDAAAAPTRSRFRPPARRARRWTARPTPRRRRCLPRSAAACGSTAWIRRPSPAAAAADASRSRTCSAPLRRPRSPARHRGADAVPDARADASAAAGRRSRHRGDPAPASGRSRTIACAVRSPRTC